MIKCRIIILNSDVSTVAANLSELPVIGDLISVPHPDGISASACIVRSRIYYANSVLLMVEEDDSAEAIVDQAIIRLIRDGIDGGNL